MPDYGRLTGRSHNNLRSHAITDKESEKMTVSIDEAIESGDPELIAQALAAEEAKTPDAYEQDVSNPESDEPKGEESAPSGDEAEETQRVIKSKSGKHEIPYEVLESTRQSEQRTREENQKLQAELESLRQEKAQNDQTLEKLTGRLESQGMDIDNLLGDPDSLTDEQWSEIESDYGDLGRAVRQLIKQQSHIESSITNTAQTSNQQTVNLDPVDTAIENNKDLNEWRQGDEKRWSVAVSYDQFLRDHPNWKDKSLDERFAEAVRLTKEELGTTQSNARQKAQEAIDKTQSPLPESLTDVGGQPVAEKSDIDALMELPADELAARMETLPQRVVDEILERGF